MARESPKSDIYAPMSYIVITERDDNPNLYVAGQEHKKVITLDILPMKQQLEATKAHQLIADGLSCY